MVEFLISTRAKITPCRVCGQDLLIGWDRGLQARVDATPVDAAGELTALLAGTWSYAHTRDGYLIHRDADKIRDGFVGTAVHATHRHNRVRAVLPL